MQNVKGNLKFFLAPSGWWPRSATSTGLLHLWRTYRWAADGFDYRDDAGEKVNPHRIYPMRKIFSIWNYHRKQFSRYA